MLIRERLKVFEAADTDGGASDQVQRLMEQLKESHVRCFERACCLIWLT
jgi:hypothetical protein